jgi:hypothetical protein
VTVRTLQRSMPTDQPSCAIHCRFALQDLSTPLPRVALATQQCALVPAKVRAELTTSHLQRCNFVRAIWIGLRSRPDATLYRQLDLTRKKQIAAVAVLTRYFPLHRTPPTSSYPPFNGLGMHSTSKVPNWLRNAQLCGRPLVKCVARTDTGLACAANGAEP